MRMLCFRQCIFTKEFECDDLGYFFGKFFPQKVKILLCYLRNEVDSIFINGSCSYMHKFQVNFYASLDIIHENYIGKEESNL